MGKIYELIQNKPNVFFFLFVVVLLASLGGFYFLLSTLYHTVGLVSLSAEIMEAVFEKYPYILEELQNGTICTPNICMKASPPLVMIGEDGRPI